MGTKFGKPTRRELLEALRERYRIASKPDKFKILDEFIDITKCHRKHAIRLLTGDGPVMPKATRPGRTITPRRSAKPSSSSGKLRIASVGSVSKRSFRG